MWDLLLFNHSRHVLYVIDHRATEDQMQDPSARQPATKLWYNRSLCKIGTHLKTLNEVLNSGVNFHEDTVSDTDL